MVMPTDAVVVVRVYDDPGRKEGDYRVLVDRLWPRGLTKAAVDQDEWDKTVAPSGQLRRWYGRRPERFDEFARRYVAELGLPPAVDDVARLAALTREQRLVLLTATRDLPTSGAAVLRSAIQRIRSEGPPQD